MLVLDAGWLPEALIEIAELLGVGCRQACLGFEEGESVSITTVSNDDVTRELEGMSVHAFDIPQGCMMGYYPECNPLIPLYHHAKKSLVPAAK